MAILNPFKSCPFPSRLEFIKTLPGGEKWTFESLANINFWVNATNVIDPQQLCIYLFISLFCDAFCLAIRSLCFNFVNNCATTAFFVLKECFREIRELDHSRNLGTSALGWRGKNNHYKIFNYLEMSTVHNLLYPT